MKGQLECICGSPLAPVKLLKMLYPGLEAIVVYLRVRRRCVVLDTPAARTISCLLCPSHGPLAEPYPVVLAVATAVDRSTSTLVQGSDVFQPRYHRGNHWSAGLLNMM